MAKAFVLFEREVNADIGRLDQAWREEPTFVFLPDRSGVEPSWIEDRLGFLPPALHTGHFILLTSGSTGQPRLIVGERGRAERLAELLHQLQDAEPVQETIVTLPLTYCYAFVNQWLWSRRMKRCLLQTAGFKEPDRLREAFGRAANAMVCLVGAQVPLLLHYFADDRFPGILRIHFAGGRFPQEHVAALGKLFPAAVVFNNYGCAEAMPRLTIRRADAGSQAGEIGRPLPGIELTSDADNRLRFRSPFGAVGFIEQEGFKPVHDGDWVTTGDLARMDPDGRWQLLGREVEVFKRYGEKVSLAQILSTVRSLRSGIAEAYREVDRNGEEGYVLVLSPPPEDNEVMALMQNFSRTHARAQWPLRVESLPEMPLLGNDKVDRGALGRQSNLKIHWSQRT